MPCNAVATLSATAITTQHLAAEAVRRAILPFLATQYGEPVQIIKDGYYRHPNDITIQVGQYMFHGFFININTATGRIDYRATPGKYAGKLETIRATCAPHIAKIAGALFQAKTKAAIERIAAITGEQRTPDGSLVLNIEL